MKHLSVFFCLTLTSLQLFSQKQVQINHSEESVYPVYVDSTDFLDNPESLKAFFLTKDIVGMGEATHGTHEFFEIKSKMFRFLVEHCNYKVFALEASYGAELYLDDYVKGGDSTDIRNYLDWPWGTEEVRDLMEWIKAYNKDKRDSEKVSFYGVDMQNITPPITYLNHLFCKDSSDFSHAFRAITPLLTTHSEMELFTLIQQDRSALTDSLKAVSLKLQKWVSDYKPVLVEKYSLKHYERIHLCIENFNQSVISVSGTRLPYFYRDSCMAVNVLKIRNIENAKTFVWAHNGHIGLEYKKTLVMGSFLKQALNEHYYAVGFVFDHGTFMAYKGPNTMAGALVKFLFARKHMYKGLIVCSTPSNKKNTLTHELHKTNLTSFFIDLNTTSNTLFTNAQYAYDIGATYMNSRRASGKIEAKKTFDGLIYVNESSCTHLLD